MTTIGRPPLVHTPPAAPARVDAARQAFFAQAMGAAQPVAAEPVTSPTVRAAPQVQPIADAERPLRPGSLLDIRV